MTYRRLKGHTDATGVATVMPKKFYYNDFTQRATPMTTKDENVMMLNVRPPTAVMVQRRPAW